MPSLPFEEFTQRPRFNIAPSQFVPVVRVGEKSRRLADLARWGFIPSWSAVWPKIQPINARAENLGTSAMFREAFAQRRCLVPADGFYEWKKEGKSKRPMFIHEVDDSVFCFAGLWEAWRSPEGEAIVSMTILTTTPNRMMAPIHNRMPVILHRKDYDCWLNPASRASALRALLAPFPDERLRAYTVSSHVNNPKNDDPECTEPKESGPTLWP
jgi:putative SOS response-associated peptidase YedK